MKEPVGVRLTNERAALLDGTQLSRQFIYGVPCSYWSNGVLTIEKYARETYLISVVHGEARSYLSQEEADRIEIVDGKATLIIKRKRLIY